MATYPLATLGPTIDVAGISIPAYNDILQSLIASFQLIYGNDIVVSADSQDGEWLAVLAKAINDQNQACMAVYHSLSPTYAQGQGLSSNVKLSAISRNVPTNSTAVGTVSGTPGTTISTGIVRDINGNLWDVPVLTIPLSGSIVTTVTAQQKGAITAQIGDINKIYNPQFGWASFTNTVASVAGAPVETDATLRRRQEFSSALPALGILAAIYSAIGNVSGVTRWMLYENATSFVDINGLPAHSFCAVVEGGTVNAIGAAIILRKPPGIQTYGSTSVTLTDTLGLATTVNYDVLAYLETYVFAELQSLSGYSVDVETEIIAAISNFIQNLSIGENVYYSQVNASASLISLPNGSTFYLDSLRIGTVGFTGSITGNNLTVTAMDANSAPIIYDGSMTIFGSGVAPITISSQTSGTAGGAGVYVIAGPAQTVPSGQIYGGLSGGLVNLTVAFNQAAQCPISNISVLSH